MAFGTQRHVFTLADYISADYRKPSYVRRASCERLGFFFGYEIPWSYHVAPGVRAKGRKDRRYYRRLIVYVRFAQSTIHTDRQLNSVTGMELGR